MTADLARKREANYDVEQEQQATRWIQDVVGEEASALAGVSGASNVQEVLKDGTILCRLIMTIDPSVKFKVNTSKMAFKQMENIGQFLQACEKYGVNKVDLFQTVDLYEGQNMNAVINGIHALGRKTQSKGYTGPSLGPKEASANVREFTDEQLAAGKNVIGLQMGSNKGASQSGQNFGKSRSIMD